MNTRETRARWRAALSACALLGAWPLLSAAAPVDVRYSFSFSDEAASSSGGAAFLSATGPVTADVRGTVLGVPFRQVRTGVASGATSWNIPEGQFGLSFDDDGTSPRLESVNGSLKLERRAGTIVVDFPLLQVGSLDPVSIDLTFASDNGNMFSTDLVESAIDDAGANTLIFFESHNGLVAGVGGMLPVRVHVPLLTVASVVVVNSNTGSSATLGLVEGSVNGGALAWSPILAFDEQCIR